MISQWTTHLKDPTDKERFERHILSSRAVLERLDEILDERLKAIDLVETSVEIYKQPGWSALQAHYNGQKSNLKFIKALINLDQKETK